MREFIEIFRALSDETRLRIIHLLVLSNKALCVCEIVDALEEPQYNISRHLKVLRNAGLIEEVKDGRWVYCSLVKRSDSFINHILRAISSISNEILTSDYRELKKRLKMRVAGKCVTGIQKHIYQ